MIVKLIGGLGNQMFQYAAGRQAAERHGVPLKMDLTFLQDRTPRPDFTFRDYQLNVFKVQEEFATDEEVKKLIEPKPKKIISKLVYKVKRAINPVCYYKEKHYHFDPGIRSIPSNAYLEGFWQSEKYFSEIDNLIRREFEIKNPPHGKVADLQRTIQSLNSVSIHIRRGDYVANKATNTYHGVCSLDYYRMAIDHLSSKFSELHFFIFSDEIQWAKENLKLDAPHTFVEKDHALPDVEDMRLMSSCRHHIIANSSFSWWAAWLNNRKDKIVIAPKIWFNDASINTNDLIPQTWVRL